MDSTLFPNVLRGGGLGSTWWGLDADTLHHRDTQAKPTDLVVSEDAEIGRLYGPDGRSFRVVREHRPRPRFGFCPGDAE